MLSVVTTGVSGVPTLISVATKMERDCARVLEVAQSHFDKSKVNALTIWKSGK